MPRRTPPSVALHLSAALVVAALSGCQWASSGQNTLGARLYEQGQYTAALQHFQKAIERDPTGADGYYNLAATNHRLGVHRGDTSQLTQAESLYNQCLDHDPNHVECHRALAVLLNDTGRPDRAFALMKNWAAEQPNYAEPRIELARLYEEVRQPETALKYLEDAVQKDSNNARAWIALARLREQSGDVNQAIANYQRGISLGGGGAAAADRVAVLVRQVSGQYESQVAASGGTPQIASGMVRNRY